MNKCTRNGETWCVLGEISVSQLVGRGHRAGGKGGGLQGGRGQGGRGKDKVAIVFGSCVTLVVRQRMGKAPVVQSARTLPMGRCASPGARCADPAVVVVVGVVTGVCMWYG